MTNLRIGHGYDVHRLVAGRPLILGGISIPYELGLDGHSDADVLIHAIMDGLAGAVGVGDIGGLFPDTDHTYKGISSLILLEAVAKLLKEQGYSVVNIDATLIAQRPKVALYRKSMEQSIARTLNMDEQQVNVKATTEEHLGFTGEGLGMAAHAVVLIEKV